MLIIQIISKANSPPKDSPIILIKTPTIWLVPIYAANRLTNRTVIFRSSSLAMPKEGPILRRPTAMLGLSVPSGACRHRYNEVRKLVCEHCPSVYKSPLLVIPEHLLLRSLWLSPNQSLLTLKFEDKYVDKLHSLDMGEPNKPHGDTTSYGDMGASHF